ncbi:hypothetical protein WICMUC_005287 [Wickerhamomyces mucosus]|uniref:RanBD1 domain-containing protein n=1 Tax=Wickerhamomyces mucosus TaxID=1378264 RepID=A0A9P8P9M2_9ASCO|nr:hypothetical protein WICMUC_005287 [Wickerhamomyces mucosus]
MSGKRRAGDQVTRENLHEFEDNNEDEVAPQISNRAPDDVLAKRKILKPRSRTQRASDSAGKQQGLGGFGSKTDSKSANESGGFDVSFQPKKGPTFSFVQTAATPNTEAKPKANAFGFLNKKVETSTESKPANVFSFLNHQTSPSSLAISKKTEEASDKPNKIKALNDNFYSKITEQRSIDPVSNFTPILRKYIDYYDRIENDIDIPDADSKEKEQKSLPAPELPSKTAFSFSLPGTTNTSSAPLFSFGDKKAGVSSLPFEKESTPMDESQTDIKVDEISSKEDSESDEDFKVEGPKFILEKPPTTTDSIFQISKDSQVTNTRASGPSFTFTSTNKNSESVFKLKPATPNSATAKKLPVQADASSEGTSNFSWAPGKPVKFSKDTPDSEKPPALSISKSSGEKDVSEKPFSFGTSSAAQGAPKSSFSFPATSTTTQSDASKGKFSLENSLSSASATKPAFSFGTSLSSEPKTDFSFGSSSTAASAENNTITPFGSNSSNSKPAFTFGGSSAASSTFNFSFNKPNSAVASDSAQDGKDSEDKVDGAESTADFAPVARLGEKVEEKTGEEEEDILYSKRSKLMLFDPANKESPYTNKGLGELKILKNKETAKSRILVRADGSNRVILNAAVNKDLTYSLLAGSKNAVRIPIISSEGKIDTYIAKVKTEVDSQNLLKSLNEAKE